MTHREGEEEEKKKRKDEEKEKADVEEELPHSHAHGLLERMQMWMAGLCGCHGDASHWPTSFEP